jgi:hypothetical protein
MTSKETAGDKLVASIRKTKTGTTTGGTSSTSTTGYKTTKKKVVKKTLQRSGQKAMTAPPAKTTETSNRKAQLIDLFQFGRRVWPD